MHSQEDLRKLEANLRFVFRGKILDVFPDSYTCRVITQHGVTYDDIPIGQTGTFGAGSTSHIPEIGTAVLIARTGNTVAILKYYPPRGRGEPNYPLITNSNVNANSEKDTSNDQRVGLYQAGQPVGMLQGDYVTGNQEGAYLGVLRGGLLICGSGPNASVMAFTTDDLLRISGRNLQQITDAGLTQITNDEGEVNTERYHSVMYFETVGEETEGAAFTENTPSDEKPKIKKINFDRQSRYRMHEFSGYLGDVFHLFVTKRPKTNKRLQSDTPVGVAEIFIGQDGALRVRSCREITLEKVAKIRVPKKTREPWMNDKGDSKDKGYSRTPHDFYNWDDGDGAGRSLQQPEHRNQQIDHEELRHFRDHKKDWNVQSEQKVQKPEPGKDIFEGSSEDDYYETTSMFTMRDDGSVFVEDAWGSTVELTHEDCILSARRDIRLVAGRDLTAVAGRDMTLRGTEYVDIVAHKEDLRLKGNKNALLYADKETASIDSGTKNTVINSRQGKVLVRAEKDDIKLHADQGAIKAVSVKKDIKLRSKKDLVLMSDTTKLGLFAKTEIVGMANSKIDFMVGEAEVVPDMDASPRQCKSKTNTPKITDGSNVAAVNGKTFIRLVPGQYILDCPGEPRICKMQGTRAINNNDGENHEVFDQCDAVCTYNSNRKDETSPPTPIGDSIWTVPGGLPSITGTVEGPKADEYKDEMALGRFRWRETFRDDIKFYETVWGHKGKVSINYATEEWQNKYKPDDQEVPDAGMKRQISGDEQLCEDSECEQEGVTGGVKKEQLAPFSKYKIYEDGDYSWENTVTPGKFKDSCDIQMPTAWTKAEENHPKGRNATYPGGSGETNPAPEQPQDSDITEKPIENNDRTCGD